MPAKREPTIIDRLKKGERVEKPTSPLASMRGHAAEREAARARRPSRDERLAVAAQQRAAKARERAEYEARQRAKQPARPVVAPAPVNEYAAQRELVDRAQRERRLNEVAANAGRPLPYPDRADADRKAREPDPKDISGVRAREHAEHAGRVHRAHAREAQVHAAAERKRLGIDD